MTEDVCGSGSNRNSFRTRRLCQKSKARMKQRTEEDRGILESYSRCSDCGKVRRCKVQLRNSNTADSFLCVWLCALKCREDGDDKYVEGGGGSRTGPLHV
jgi:hypothetical protein